MEITVKRIYFRDTCTIGAIQVNGKYMMDTLEPHAINWQKEKKVAGKTAIPEGRYRVSIQYSKTFKRNMPFLENVPYFTGIMIHSGNTVKNTRGCILVGRAYNENEDENGNLNENDNEDGNTNLNENGNVNKASECRLVNSRIYFQKLYALISDAIKDGEQVWVTVRSQNGWRA